MQSKFQQFVGESMLYLSKIEQETMIELSTVKMEGKEQIAHSVTDLDDDQLYWGSWMLNDYSDYLCDQESYINKLKGKLCVN